MRRWDEPECGVCDSRRFSVEWRCVRGSELCGGHVLPARNCAASVPCGIVSRRHGRDVRGCVHAVHCRCGGVLCVGVLITGGCFVPARVFLRGWCRDANCLRVLCGVRVHKWYRCCWVRDDRQLRDDVPGGVLLPRVHASVALCSRHVQHRRVCIHIRGGVSGVRCRAIWAGFDRRCGQHCIDVLGGVHIWQLLSGGCDGGDWWRRLDRERKRRVPCWLRLSYRFCADNRSVWARLLLHRWQHDGVQRCLLFVPGDDNVWRRAGGGRVRDCVRGWIFLRRLRGPSGLHDVSCGFDVRCRARRRFVLDDVPWWVLLRPEFGDSGVRCGELQRHDRRIVGVDVHVVYGCGGQLLSACERCSGRCGLPERVLLLGRVGGQGSRLLCVGREHQRGVRGASWVHVCWCSVRRCELRGRLLLPRGHGAAAVPRW